MSKKTKRKQWHKDRRLAVKLAARFMAGRPDDPLHPHLWCVTVFFESYLAMGAGGTAQTFGPKEPVKLRVAGGATPDDAA